MQKGLGVHPPLTEKGRDYHMSIPTREGGTCMQKPYRLSHREVVVFKEQVEMLLT
jgi:hypothetical protein